MYASTKTINPLGDNETIDLKIYRQAEIKSIQMAKEIINDFSKIYSAKWLEMMRKKLGLFNQKDNDEKLITELLSWMYKKKVDYTNTFCILMNHDIENSKFYNDEVFLKWKEKWKIRLKLNNKPFNESIELMRKVNPLVIPRNHKVEEVLDSANNNDIKPLEKFLRILKKPYEDHYQEPGKPIKTNIFLDLRQIRSLLFLLKRIT